MPLSLRSIDACGGGDAGVVGVFGELKPLTTCSLHLLDQVRRDVVLAQVGVALLSVARLDLVGAVQALVSGLGDVDAPGNFLIGGVGSKQSQPTLGFPRTPCGWPRSHRRTRCQTATSSSPKPHKGLTPSGFLFACSDRPETITNLDQQALSCVFFHV
jgi:hypothetical protein